MRIFQTTISERLLRQKKTQKTRNNNMYCPKGILVHIALIYVTDDSIFLRVIGFNRLKFCLHYFQETMSELSKPYLVLYIVHTMIEPTRNISISDLKALICLVDNLIYIFFLGVLYCRILLLLGGGGDFSFGDRQ
jgi:hypothetical protein